jgi:hypothetical protein
MQITRENQEVIHISHKISPIIIKYLSISNYISLIVLFNSRPFKPYSTSLSPALDHENFEAKCRGFEAKLTKVGKQNKEDK